MQLIIGYLVLINIIGFLFFRSDKKRARNNTWRISEKTLWMVAWLGGSLGCVIGMNTYRHKTKRQLFRIGMPLLVLSQAIFLYTALALL